jgi:hypothetical protein
VHLLVKLVRPTIDAALGAQLARRANACRLARSHLEREKKKTIKQQKGEKDGEENKKRKKKKKKKKKDDEEKKKQQQPTTSTTTKYTNQTHKDKKYIQ